MLAESEVRRERRSLDKWLEKWEFILQSDHELSKAGAYTALQQLHTIVEREVKN